MDTQISSSFYIGLVTIQPLYGKKIMINKMASGQELIHVPEWYF